MANVTQIRCKDVQASFARRRAEIVDYARQHGMQVMFDDGVAFRAIQHDPHATSDAEVGANQAGAPFVNGPCIWASRYGTVHETLLLPKR